MFEYRHFLPLMNAYVKRPWYHNFCLEGDGQFVVDNFRPILVVSCNSASLEEVASASVGCCVPRKAHPLPRATTPVFDAPALWWRASARAMRMDCRTRHQQDASPSFPTGHPRGHPHRVRSETAGTCPEVSAFECRCLTCDLTTAVFMI